MAGQEPSEDALVLGGGPLAYACLNRYPYASGHLMICPRLHHGDFASLERASADACTALLQTCCEVIGGAMRPDGFNIGMNLGKAAGAGLPGHLHWHIVPRWDGDTNFMPLLSELRVIPEHLRSTWRRLAGPLQEALRASGGEEKRP
jgi:ATP adenylyltransferase